MVEWEAQVVAAANEHHQSVILTKKGLEGCWQNCTSSLAESLKTGMPIITIALQVNKKSSVRRTFAISWRQEAACAFYPKASAVFRLQCLGSAHHPPAGDHTPESQNRHAIRRMFCSRNDAHGIFPYHTFRVRGVTISTSSCHASTALPSNPVTREGLCSPLMNSAVKCCGSRDLSAVFVPQTRRWT